MSYSSPLPPSFWVETGLLVASSLVLWLVVVFTKRSQSRRRYQNWQGSASSVPRKGQRSGATD